MKVSLIKRLYKRNDWNGPNTIDDKMHNFLDLCEFVDKTINRLAEIIETKSRLKREYEIQLEPLENEESKIMSDCKHPLTTFHQGANMDSSSRSYDLCDICGKVLEC